jgi:hypothetical protein
MPSDGGRARELTTVEGEYPTWSPGAWRSCQPSPDARGSNSNYDVFIVNRDGSGLRRLTSWPGDDGFPTWSPDGSQIAFATGITP